MLSSLEVAIAANDPDAVQQAIFDLASSLGTPLIDEEVARQEKENKRIVVNLEYILGHFG